MRLSCLSTHDSGSDVPSVGKLNAFFFRILIFSNKAYSETSVVQNSANFCFHHHLLAG
jgi:hypothetical protein